MTVLAIVLALLVTVVPLLAAWSSIIYLMASWLLILPAALWIGLRIRRDGARGARVAAALLLTYGVTMLCVYGAQWPVNPPPAVHAHPPRGEVIVFVHAGLPWPGVGGSRNGLAHDEIPLVGGIDALLANFSFWLLGAWLGLRRVKDGDVAIFFWLGLTVALLGVYTGGWALVQMFD